MHQYQMHHEDQDQWGVDHPSSITHGAEVMLKIQGSQPRRKHNLMAQVIPLYGFGIFLYIFYIIYKLTCNGKTVKSGNSAIPDSSMGHKKIINCELIRLQERLQQAETVMERIVSKKQSSRSGRRRKSKGTPSKNEEKLLFQLRQFSQLMQDGRLEGASPEMEAEEVPYGADWEGYPEETYPVYNDDDEYRGDDEDYPRPRIPTFMLLEPSQQLSAEALAERMEQVEEQAMARKLSIVREVDEEEEDEEDKEEEEDETEEDIEEEEEEEAEAEKRHLLSVSSAQMEREERLGLEISNELQGFNGGKKQISFSEHTDVFHYPKEETYREEDQEGDGDEEDEGEEETDEDDPVIEAESLQFSRDGCLNPEEEAERAVQESLLTSEDGGGGPDVHTEVPRGVQASGLRMRNRRET
eukprot:XP_011608525.1 PREDICTED: protein RIC-3-like [Takifugu rubripes]